MAVPLAQPVFNRAVRCIEAGAARWLREHAILLGTPAGFFADDASDDGPELRNEYRDSEADNVRSASGSGDDSKSGELPAAVRAGVVLDWRRPQTVSWPRRSHPEFPELQHFHADHRSDVLARLDTVTQHVESAAVQGSAGWRIRIPLL